jgi:hypothetical protein
MVRSILVAAIALVLGGGCRADDEYPTVPPGGGGPPGGSNGGDARTADASDGGADGTVRARVCVVADLRQPQICSPDDNVGVVVSERGTQNQATTTTGGAFELQVTATDVAVLEIGVGSSALVASIVPVDLRDPPPTMPVPAARPFQALRQALGPSEPDGTGTIAAYYLDAREAALPGVVVEAPAGAANAPWYDLAGNTPAPWNQEAETGPFGAALLFGVPAGPAAVGAVGPGLEDLSVSGVLVVDDRVTFVTVGQGD